MSSTAKDESCPYCGGYHVGICPEIQDIEYFPDGSIKKIRFWPREFLYQADWHIPGKYHQFEARYPSWNPVPE